MTQIQPPYIDPTKTSYILSEEDTPRNYRDGLWVTIKFKSRIYEQICAVTLYIKKPTSFNDLIQDKGLSHLQVLHFSVEREIEDERKFVEVKKFRSNERHRIRYFTKEKLRQLKQEILRHINNSNVFVFERISPNNLIHNLVDISYENGDIWKEKKLEIFNITGNKNVFRREFLIVDKINHVSKIELAVQSFENGFFNLKFEKDNNYKEVNIPLEKTLLNQKPLNLYVSTIFAAFLDSNEILKEDKSFDRKQWFEKFAVQRFSKFGIFQKDVKLDYLFSKGYLTFNDRKGEKTLQLILADRKSSEDVFFIDVNHWNSKYSGSSRESESRNRYSLQDDNFISIPDDDEFFERRNSEIPGEIQKYRRKSRELEVKMRNGFFDWRYGTFSNYGREENRRTSNRQTAEELQTPLRIWMNTKKENAAIDFVLTDVEEQKIRKRIQTPCYTYDEMLAFAYLSENMIRGFIPPRQIGDQSQTRNSELRRAAKKLGVDNYDLLRECNFEIQHPSNEKHIQFTAYVKIDPNYGQGNPATKVFCNSAEMRHPARFMVLEKHSGTEKIRFEFLIYKSPGKSVNLEKWATERVEFSNMFENKGMSYWDLFQQANAMKEIPRQGLKSEDYRLLLPAGVPDKPRNVDEDVEINFMSWDFPVNLESIAMDKQSNYVIPVMQIQD